MCIKKEKIRVGSIKKFYKLCCIKILYIYKLLTNYEYHICELLRGDITNINIFHCLK